MEEADVIERFVGRSDAAIQADIEAHLGRALPADWARFAGGLTSGDVLDGPDTIVFRSMRELPRL